MRMLTLFTAALLAGTLAADAHQRSSGPPVFTGSVFAV